MRKAMHKADREVQKGPKKERRLKVIRQNSNGYVPTPTIMLKGQWLAQFGFDFDTPVKVTCSEGQLVITKVKGYTSPMDILMQAVAEENAEYGGSGK